MLCFLPSPDPALQEQKKRQLSDSPTAGKNSLSDAAPAAGAGPCKELLDLPRVETSGGLPAFATPSLLYAPSSLSITPCPFLLAPHSLPLTPAPRSYRWMNPLPLLPTRSDFDWLQPKSDCSSPVVATIYCDKRYVINVALW